jgi:hypothetical protein
MQIRRSFLFGIAGSSDAESGSLYPQEIALQRGYGSSGRMVGNPEIGVAR